MSSSLARRASRGLVLLLKGSVKRQRQINTWQRTVHTQLARDPFSVHTLDPAVGVIPLSVQFRHACAAHLAL